jgi:hypothetical protein
MRPSHAIGRRRAFASALALPLLFVERWSRADTVAVPPPLQARLTAKLAAFDRSMGSRAGSVVRVLVVQREEPASQRIARELVAGFQGIPTIAGLPHEELEATYDSPPGVLRRIRDSHASVVFFSAGFVNEAESIANSLRDVNVLTVTAEPAAVSRGIVVGYDLVSGQPKILVNLNQARAQHVALPAALLSLAVIVGGA